MSEKKKALVIGAAGLLGYSVTRSLCDNGWKVRAVDKNSIIMSGLFDNRVESLCGDIFDAAFINKSLEDIDIVYFFLSSFLPSASLDNKNNIMYDALESVLDKMIEQGISEVVFPSSGGAIYGNIISRYAKEEDMPAPVTSYGIERLECEKLLERYATLGISSMILRIGNVYGGNMYREVKQGVIDIFVQKVLKDEEITIWGNALNNIRDYIFMDDFVDAVYKTSAREFYGINIYNVGSGVGVSLGEILEIIEDKLEKPLRLKYIPNDVTDSIERIILDCGKIKSEYDWAPQYDIERGIVETIKRKMDIMK